MSERQQINLNDPEFLRHLETMRHRHPARSDAQVYVHRGMWVADCAYPSCSNAERIDFGDAKVYCTACHYIAHLTWPSDALEIMAVLDVRPVPETRHWAPAGHRQAIACGFPDGQTVADLMDENEENL